MFDREKVIVDAEKAIDILSKVEEPTFWCDFVRVSFEHTLELLKAEEWHDASERPPRIGRYLVVGLTYVVPDHNDQPNAFWEVRMGDWMRSGWYGKVKYWRELPEPPHGVVLRRMHEGCESDE